jgi:hypothetical protein
LETPNIVPELRIDEAQSAAAGVRRRRCGRYEISAEPVRAHNPINPTHIYRRSKPKESVSRVPNSLYADWDRNSPLHRWKSRQ